MQFVSAVNNCFLHCQTKHTLKTPLPAQKFKNKWKLMNNFFLLLILYRDTKVHLAKAAKQFKATQSWRTISMPGFVACFLVWFFFSPKQPLVLCTHKTSFKKDTQWALFYMFFVVCLVRTLSLEFLGMLNKIIAWRLGFSHVSGNNTKP